MRAVRAAILNAANSFAPLGGNGADFLTFTGALAPQCFINECLFAVSAVERAEIKPPKTI